MLPWHHWGVERWVAASLLCSHFCLRGPAARCVHHQLDPDFQDGWRNDIEARLGGLPTGPEIADQYLTPAAVAATYATQTTVNMLSTNANAAQVALNATLTRIVAAVDGVSAGDFPICDPLPVPTRGNTTDHEEHVPGTVVGISCNQGYALAGATEAICLSNATWAYRGAIPTCTACGSQWLDVPWALDRWENIQGPGSRGRDYRTGNPQTTSSFNLPAIDIGTNGVSGLRFYFQCTCAPNNPLASFVPVRTHEPHAQADACTSRPPSHPCTWPNLPRLS